MKKSVSTVYGVLLVIGFILMALSFAFTGKKNTSFAEDFRRIELQPDRVVEVSEDVREYYFDCNQMQSEFSELTFFSVHQCVEVYADGEQVYSLEKSSTVFGRTPGTGWNTIQLQEGVKSFCVRIEAVYPAVRDHVTRFYQENDGQMVYQTMRGSVPEIMVSTVDGAIGIMLLIYYVIARRKVKMGPGILYFGIFTLMMGMWSMNEAELVAYMVKSRTAASYAGYMLIMLMIAPFAAFLQEFSEVEEKYISNIICICSFANVVVCTVLHMTGICEFKNTVFCTHFLMACDLLYLLYVILQRYRARGMDRRVRVCIWGLVILLVSYAVDMSAYYIGWRRTDVIGRFGFLLFICLLAREATAVSMEKIDEGRKAEIYRELAEHDMPTGLYNRNAYDEWASENARDRETAIVTFDLNDLKYCNDTFGHAAGDKYIQDAAKLMGIDTNKVIELTFVISGVLACIAGTMVAMYYRSIETTMGSLIGTKIFAAAILGGVGILPGAMVGGILLGIVETMVSAYISTGYRDAISFTILIVVLLFMPNGMFGKKAINKV